MLVTMDIEKPFDSLNHNFKFSFQKNMALLKFYLMGKDFA